MFIKQFVNINKASINSVILCRTCSKLCPHTRLVQISPACLTNSSDCVHGCYASWCHCIPGHSSNERSTPQRILASQLDCSLHLSSRVAVYLQRHLQMPQLSLHILLAWYNNVLSTSRFCLGQWLDNLCRYLLSVRIGFLLFVTQAAIGPTSRETPRDRPALSLTIVNWMRG